LADWKVVWLVDGDKRHVSERNVLVAGQASIVCAFVQPNNRLRDLDSILTALRLAKTAIVITDRPGRLCAQLNVIGFPAFRPTVVAAFLLQVSRFFCNYFLADD
jgi:hypothetical protein